MLKLTLSAEIKGELCHNKEERVYFGSQFKGILIQWQQELVGAGTLCLVMNRNSEC